MYTNCQLNWSVTIYRLIFTQKNYSEIFLFSSQILEISLQVLETLIWPWSISQMQLNTTLQSLSKNMSLLFKVKSLIVLKPPLVVMQCFNGYFCHRLFGNRSFCFEKMQEYMKALTDAELSLSMCPGWVKGLFRKGRALAGLKVNKWPLMKSAPCIQCVPCWLDVCWGRQNIVKVIQHADTFATALPSFKQHVAQLLKPVDTGISPEC